jgi:hypothetical protein
LEESEVSLEATGAVFARSLHWTTSDDDDDDADDVFMMMMMMMMYADV